MLRRITVLTLAAALAVTAPTNLAAKEKEAAKPVDPAADINAPQPGARRIAFTTEQGTWTSVDLSPDGATIVFDLVGDLYTLPIGGGKATRITSGPAWDSQPRFSPDGRTIAFTSDRGGTDNLWLADADGENARALTEEKDLYTRTADWTPDGEYLIARREDGKLAGIPPVELYLFSRHGGSGVQLTSSDDTHNASGAVASADGRFIYFARRQRPFNYIPNLQDGLWQIARHDRRTGKVAQLTGGYGGAVRPAISPDGGKLAYVSRRDGATVLVVRDLASGAEKVVARDLGRDEMEGFATSDLYPGYSFTPDGEAIVLSDRGRIFRIDVATGARTAIPFRADVEQWAAPRVSWQDGVEKGDVRVRALQGVAETPARDAIVFQALGRIWRQPLADGRPSGAPVRLTPEREGLPTREYAPAISPDGAWVAYVSWSDRELGRVWKVRTSGGEPVQLTPTAAHYANPAWSADGSRLAVLRGSGLELRGRQPEEEAAFELHLLPASGGATSYVATVGVGTGQRFHPHVTFVSDEAGERLLYAEPVPGKKPTEETKTDLVSIRPDGSDRKVHVRLPVASEVAPSPDLRWVAFNSRDAVYVAAWPPFAKEEVVELSLSGGPLPVQRLSDPAGVNLRWAEGGKTLTWSLGDTFHRLPLARALDFIAAEKAEAAAKAKAGAGEAKKDGKKAEKATEEKEPDLKLPKSDSFRIALTAPRAGPAGSFVLKNANVVTMKGDEILTAADVVVSGNRIAAVGPSGSVAVPAGATELDATGKTVIPGLIDTHAHLHYSAFENYPETKWEYLANLAYGVTTTYDPSAPTIDVFAQAELVETGRMTGPRIYSSGMVLYGGQAQDFWAQVDDLEDARRQVKRMQAWGARMIKVYQQPRRAQRRWFAEAARQEGMLLTAEGGGELFNDLTMALDGYTAFEHSLPDELGDDFAKLLAGTKTHYTPTLLVSYGGPWGELYFWQTANPHDDPKLNRFTPHFVVDNWGRRHPWVTPSDYHFPIVAEGVAKVFHEGGNVSLGAHGQMQGIGPHWELWAMAGENARSASSPRLTPHQALRAATERAADKLGLLPDLGTVEAGKLADLVVLDADPLADIHNSTKIRWVVKNGELFEGETMKRILPSVVEPPHQYWQ
jgi:Tol biopolymer transport system component/imidazolonepropionase-like amidohydrolase